MDASKVRQLISDLKDDIAAKSKAIQALEALLEEDRPRQATLPAIEMVSLRDVAVGSLSYVDLAARAIEHNNGQPTHMTEIVNYIREVKGNPHIERRSVEATIIQHMKTKKEMARFIKVRPGVWAMRRYPRTEPAA